MLPGLVEDAPDNIEPVGAAVEGKLRLGAAFARQGGHAVGVDIGRIGDDEIVASVAERLEQVAAVKREAILKAVIADVASGDLERVL